MIARDSLTEVGTLFKPHGIKGELNAELDEGLGPDDLRCIVLDIDGIFTPFFLEGFRPKGADRWLLKIDGIDTERQAAEVVNHQVYALTDELPEEWRGGDGDGVHLFDLVGYTLFDGESAIGEIAGIDDSTANVLLIVRASDGRTVYVPFAEEFLTEIDTDARRLVMDVPRGIINLNK